MNSVGVLTKAIQQLSARVRKIEMQLWHRDPITAHYISSVQQTVQKATFTVHNYETEWWDTHDLVTTGVAWVWTANKDMYVNVEAQVFLNSVAWVAGNTALLYLRQNAGLILALDRWVHFGANATYSVLLSGATEVKVSKNDTLDLEIYQTTANPINTYAANIWWNHVSIYET